MPRLQIHDSTTYFSGIWENLFVAFLLGGIILLFGYFGGLINQILESSQDRKKSILFGIGASALVPLFLNLTESDLLTRLFNPANAKPDEPYLKALFVFASMCLLASIISERFIQTLSDQMLAKRLDDIEEKVENPEEPDIQIEAENLEQVAPGEALSKEEEKALQALMERPNVWRARSPISRDAKFGFGDKEKRAQLRGVLNKLVERGFAESRLSPNDGKPRWRLAKGAASRFAQDEDEE